MSNQPPNNEPWQQPDYQPYPQQPPPPNTSYPPQQPNQTGGLPSPPNQPYQSYPQQPIYPPPPMQQPPKKPSFWSRKIVGIPMWLCALIIFIAIVVANGVFANRTTSNNSTPVVVQSTPTTAAADTPVPTDTPQPTDTPTPAPSIAYQLDFIDSGGSLSSNDASIAQYQTLLDTLHRKTGDSEQTIADETAAGQNLVKTKYGKDVTLLELLQKTDQSLPDGAKIHFADALAAYITLAYS